MPPNRLMAALAAVWCLAAPAPSRALDFPELQRRGLFRTEYEGTMLRENLGVPFPN